MKITDLRIRQLNGTMVHPEPFWEERLIRPIDVYPTYRQQPRQSTASQQKETYQMSSVFLQIDTDDSTTNPNPKKPENPITAHAKQYMKQIRCSKIKTAASPTEIYAPIPPKNVVPRVIEHMQFFPR